MTIMFNVRTQPGFSRRDCNCTGRLSDVLIIQ